MELIHLEDFLHKGVSWCQYLSIFGHVSKSWTNNWHDSHVSEPRISVKHWQPSTHQPVNHWQPGKNIKHDLPVLSTSNIKISNLPFSRATLILPVSWCLMWYHQTLRYDLPPSWLPPWIPPVATANPTARFFESAQIPLVDFRGWRTMIGHHGSSWI